MNLLMLIMYLLVGPFLLRFAVQVVNTFSEDSSSSDSSSPIPEPPLGKAFGMMGLVVIADFLIRIFLLTIFQRVGADSGGIGIIIILLYFVLIFSSMVGIFMSILPTTAGRAIGIAILMVGAYAVIGLVIHHLTNMAMA